MFCNTFRRNHDTGAKEESTEMTTSGGNIRNTRKVQETKMLFT